MEQCITTENIKNWPLYARNKQWPPAPRFCIFAGAHRVRYFQKWRMLWFKVFIIVINKTTTNCIFPHELGSVLATQDFWKLYNTNQWLFGKMSTLSQSCARAEFKFKLGRSICQTWTLMKVRIVIEFKRLTVDSCGNWRCDFRSDKHMTIILVNWVANFSCKTSSFFFVLTLFKTIVLQRMFCKR